MAPRARRRGALRAAGSGSAGRPGWELPAVRRLPYFCRGEVVKGFGRGSKEPGIPTEALISAVQEDIEEAKRQLDLPEHLKLKDNNFFHLLEGKRVNH